MTTTDIAGEWSEPVSLFSGSFDVSLFHDDDEKKWLLFRHYEQIAIREYDEAQQKLVGPIRQIFPGTSLGMTEGPHLYKLNSYYYLLVAEGGTGRLHAVTVARSRELFGPYEVDPLNPMLTASTDPRVEIQKAGHADLVQTPGGGWYLVHLGSRPLPGRGACILGRETCIQKVTWDTDGWPRLAQGGYKPFTIVPAPDLPEHQWEAPLIRDDFDAPTLNPHFQSVRFPLDERHVSLSERPGFLRLKGGEFLHSQIAHSFVARRQQAFCYSAWTRVEFEPESHYQLAGLVCYYNRSNFYYLHITANQEGKKRLNILACDNLSLKLLLSQEIEIESWEQCYLRVDVDYDRLEFSYSQDGDAWQGNAWTRIGPTLDAELLSDEHRSETRLNFTGAFVGLCCQDLSGQGKHADFDYFVYLERESRF